MFVNSTKDEDTRHWLVKDRKEDSSDFYAS